jgi:hypothetical protein
MRKDMAKIIVERPRWGHSVRTERGGRSRAIMDDDGNPTSARELVRPKPKSKELNENLAPLKRYLAAQVGRPWNKIFSEISANLKPTSTVQQHVRDHVEDFVAVKTRMEKGVVTIVARFGQARAIGDTHYPFYVHPRTGLLKRNEAAGRRKAKVKAKRKDEAAALAKRMRVIDAKTQLHLFDGVWWEVKLAPIGDGREADVVLRAHLTKLAPEKLYARAGVRAHAKRQLSKAEKKRLELN